MDHTFFTGIIGSLTLVIGAAWPEKKIIKHPTASIKNWLFSIGGFLMLLYSIFGYLQGDSIFFVLLQIIIAIASTLMMLNVPSKINAPIIICCNIGLIIWSLYLFANYNTILFVIGITGIGVGYTFKTGTFYRNLALTLGGFIIALFSYFATSWIFFWLNLFFGLFSAYYIYRGFTHKNTHPKRTKSTSKKSNKL